MEQKMTESYADVRQMLWKEVPVFAHADHVRIRMALCPT